MLLSVILYGSRARGDHRLSSDVDLLGIADARSIEKENSVRGANLHLYPFDYLLNQSSEGNLFLLHLVSEGKILHDTAGAFEQIKKAFKYQSSYKNIVDEATLLAQFILTRQSKITSKKHRQRLIWALRSIIIASAAAEEKPVFSAAGLEEFSQVAGLKAAINQRNTINVEKLALVTKAVLNNYGSPDVIDSFPDSLVEQRQILIAKGGILESSVRLFDRKLKLRKKSQEKPRKELDRIVYIES